MYFKRLEILGFKSFCNKTILHFEPGTTAIVGPNGCGKSNIFDSIRWVLGEQSAKSMRGSSMEDVIFNGTDSKESLSMAEVNLIFDNTGKFFPVEHDEVIITRRIFRSGESEYLLNKTQVRLKDITELLMGTGIGAESYSLVPQGKIDLILSSKPEDRRVVFDEAAGVTKYKAQKKETIRRLEETDQNLLRVNDIIAEVKRQIGSLERQANKARRYKETFEELKTKETSLASIQKQELCSEKTNIETKIITQESQENQIAEIIQNNQTIILNLQNEIKNSQDAILKIKNDILNLTNIILRDKEHILFNQERAKELAANKEDWILQIEQAKSQLVTDEEKLKSLKTEFAKIKEKIEEKTSSLKDKEKLLNEISAAIKISSDAIAHRKKEILDTAGLISNARNQLNSSASKEQILLARQKRLEIEKAKVSEERNARLSTIEDIQQSIANLEQEFQNTSNSLQGAKQTLESNKSELEAINLEIINLEKQKLSLQSQEVFLKELKTKYEDISESMDAVIFLNKIPQENLTGLVIKINNSQACAETDTGIMPGACHKVSGEAKSFDLDTGKIGEKITAIAQKIESLREIKAQKTELIKTLENNLVSLNDNLHSQEIVLVNKKASHQSIINEFNKIKDEDDLITLELTDLTGELTSTRQELTRLQTQAEELQLRQTEAENSISAEQNSITHSNTRKEETLVSIAQDKTELDSLTKRISSDEQILRDLETRFERDKENFSSLTRQIEEADGRIKTLETEISGLENKINQTNLDMESLEALKLETQEKHQEISLALEESTRESESLSKKLEGLKEDSYHLQMQYKDIEFKLTSIKERLLQAYKIDFDALKPEDPQTQNTIPLEKSTITEEILKLKERLNSYGTVNLVAIEEYDELKKRYDFLSQQQTDLTTAKDSLHEAILKINRTTKKIFLETFEKIRVEFINHFKMLFNGGDAQIYLLDESDPLESGIEIICRPPGKKLQNVLLLSGGEKSMSAIALIFAIFKIKPAPFCVLDEIDAALDEANVDRFGKVLCEFKKISQFIVITHNKKTISNADLMYGITMEESGVSKIVSVKFAQDKNAAEKSPDKDINTQPVAEPV